MRSHNQHGTLKNLERRSQGLEEGIRPVHARLLFCQGTEIFGDVSVEFNAPWHLRGGDQTTCGVSFTLHNDEIGLVLNWARPQGLSAEMRSIIRVGS